MTYEPVSDTLGIFEVEPLDRGFGHTFGNSLRRVLLSSLEGAAVTSVRIEGVQHEFTAVPGVREDVTDIILALRRLVCRLHGEVSEIEVELSKSTAGPVLAGAADLVLGARRPTQWRAWPAHARLANWVLARELRRRTGQSLRDLGPMRAAGRAALLRLGLADRRSGWPLEMVLRAHQLGWRVDEVPVPYRPRTGRSKVTGTVRGTLQAVGDMAALLR